MFIYTALIFAAALVLIILAFFGQTNISNLRRSSDRANAPAAAASTQTAAPQQDALAQMANNLSSAQAENEQLKEKLAAYEELIKANAYVNAEGYDEAAEELENIDSESLTDEQQILYNQINEKINEGKEQ